MALLPGARIDELFAYVTVDPEDDIEGVVSAVSPLGMVPLIGADPERMLSYKPLAKEMSEVTGQEIRLVRFTSRQEIETL